MTQTSLASAGELTVTVPRNTRPLLPMPQERARRLREHVVRSLRSLRRTRSAEPCASPLRAEPQGFAGTLAHAACALCAGYCCKGGGEHAYLDERDLARVCQAHPELGARAIVRLYVASVPTQGYDGSCVFHGLRGCTLHRSLRSDVCNSYFCNALRDAVATANTAGQVTVTACGEDGTTRTAPALVRQQRADAVDAPHVAASG